MFDTLIHDGTVIDPDAGSVARADIALDKGRILGIEPSIAHDAAHATIDASGLYLAPGLVDLHSHVNWRTSPISIDPDALAPAAGVTTWIDAGSAYATTLESLRENVIDRSPLRILAFLRLGHGTNEIMPTAIVAQADAEILGAVAMRNRDIAVGVKVSMGQCKIDQLKLAIRAAERAELPLMVHIAQTPPDVREILALLRPGDIITHAFTDQAMRMVDEDARVLPELLRARDAGVRIDIGHGAGSFSWRIAETMIGAGIEPDTISTDVWQVSLHGPMFDLPTCLSKFLHLGMSLPAVVQAATTRPADAIGRPGEFGTLRVGSPADLVLLDLVEGAFPLYDSAGDVRHATRLFRAAATIVAGRRLPPRSHEPYAQWLEYGMAANIDPNPQGGLRAEILQRQATLVRLGHTPTQMAPIEPGRVTIRYSDLASREVS